MTLIIESDHEQLSKRASNIVSALIHNEQGGLLVLPSGDTPLGMYRQLIQKRVELRPVISDVCILVLDEWFGFGPHQPLSCQYSIRSEFLEPLGLPESNFYFLDGSVQDPTLECRRYNQLLAKIGPADLAILGLGLNGHLGLNEPASQLTAQTHMTKLAPSTLTRVKRQMGDDRAPTHGLTLGMAQIMQARQVLLLASGRQKAEAVKRMLAGPITTEFPASLLQLHPAATFLIDKASAGQLSDNLAGD